MFNAQRSTLNAFAAGGLTFSAALAWAARLWLGESVWAEDSAAVLGVTVLVMGTVATVGLLTTGGRWARRLGVGLAAGQGVLALATSIDPLWVIALVASAAASVALSGRFVTGWVRTGPAAVGPSSAAILLALGLTAAPGVVAGTAPAGLTGGDWLFSIGSWLLALSYSRAWPGVVAAARLAFPILGIVATWMSRLPAAAAILATTIALTVLAWQPGTRLAVRPLVEARAVAGRPEGRRRRSLP